MDLEKAVKNYNFLNNSIQEGFAYGQSAVLKPNDVKSNFEIVQMEWGFIPSYLSTREDVKKMRSGYKEANGKYHPPLTTLNAKGEELLLIDPFTKKPKMYRKAALERRCLVLSTGFYEWRHVYPKNKRTGEPLKTAVKYPYYISLKDQEYFYMAGIWQPWTDRQTGEQVNTMAIVTTDANYIMKQVHNSKNRMPTILGDELAWEWMMDDISEERITEIATSQYPAKLMQAYSIEKEFRASVEPTTAFTYEELPPLVLNE
ncbi:SOS response-associated peptidase [Dyadobacter frigoris]|uniref:SOS response-associated peptidase n=1 Tax=Dyadobacter frigoris TaxID=2576211 RepID=UPI002557349B|nr:SOS response-associated peptidase family protein [Dyadobacter frigoris]